MALSVAKAKDREAMAHGVEALCKELGAHCERNDILTQGREIHLRIKLPRGLELGISFDGDSRQDRAGSFCLPWCVWGPRETAKLSPAFGAAQCSTVNQFHFGKCTAFADSYDNLLEMIRAGVTMAISGEAFQ